MADFLVDRFGNRLSSGIHGPKLATPRLVRPSFFDNFNGSASDPALDATKWTENTRVGGTVNNGGNGLCRTATGASVGEFVGYATNVWEGGSVDTINIYGVTYAGAASRAELLVRDTNKSTTGRDGAGHTGNSYLVYLTRGAGGGSVKAMTAAAQRAVGSSFEWTNIADGSPHDVKVVVTQLVDRIRFECYIDASLVATIDDTNAARLVDPGYTGFVQVSFSSTTDFDGFGINN